MNDIIHEGTLPVPSDLPPRSQMMMEQFFRAKLWPHVKDGYKRWTRTFTWEDSGRTLHYRIVDVPSINKRQSA